MPISVAEIQKGWIYRTSRNQERLVLGWTSDGRVVYSSRGGNVKNPFHNCHVKSSEARFANAVDSKVSEVQDIDAFIRANNAQTVVVR